MATTRRKRRTAQEMKQDEQKAETEVQEDKNDDKHDEQNTKDNVKNPEAEIGNREAEQITNDARPYIDKLRDEIELMCKQRRYRRYSLNVGTIGDRIVIYEGGKTNILATFFMPIGDISGQLVINDGLIRKMINNLSDEYVLLQEFNILWGRKRYVARSFV